MVTGAIDKIVKGVLGPAKQKVESVLGKLLPVVIDLFAKLIGLAAALAQVLRVVSGG